MEIKVVRFSSGFSNVPDTYLLMPKDYWYTTEKATDARNYNLPDGFGIVEGDGVSEFYAISQENECYKVYNDDGEIILSPAFSSQGESKRIVLGEWK
jgi:hypothetical protein